MLKRTITDKIIADCFKGKVVIIYGPRRVGKTTLSKEIIKTLNTDGLYLNCDDIKTREELTNKDTSELLQLLKGYKVIVIDEAQRVQDIGITLKRIIDAIPNTVQIIATGSSSFDLSNKTKEPLTGRSVEYMLYPLSIHELTQQENIFTSKSLLMDRVLYGLYPEIVLGDVDRKKTLYTLTEQYLYKDLLSYNGIRKPELLQGIIRLLAKSVGSLISYSEIANTLDISKETVKSYVSILEQAFIIYQIKPFHKNPRLELSKKRKIYFIDTGILNMVLENMTPFDVLDRDMKGHIWENFIFTERIKFMKNNDHYMMHWFFWRTKDGQELDMIEQEELSIKAFEIKWNINNHYLVPKKWKENYPDIRVEFIDTKNFFDMIWKD